MVLQGILKDSVATDYDLSARENRSFDHLALAFIQFVFKHNPFSAKDELTSFEP